MDRLQRDPARRLHLSQALKVFEACVAEDIVGRDGIDWVASCMQELTSEGLIKHGPASLGSYEPALWNGYWIQSLGDWRVTAAGRADAALFRREQRLLAEAIPARDSHDARGLQGEHDVFISHASEDKADVARPLADALSHHGWNVWLDELELTIGDSLNGSINEALSRSSFGVVILSPTFFEKQWAMNELAGLAAKEATSSAKVILPVWHGIDEHFLAERMPVLADRLGASTAAGIDDVASKINRALEKAGRPRAAGLSRESVLQGLEPESSPSTGRRTSLPVSDEAQMRMSIDKPEFWEHILFAGILAQGKQQLEPKWRDHELRLARGERREYTLSEVADFIDRETNWMSRRTGVVNRIFASDVQERAFGPRGEHGDAEHIRQFAGQVLSLYESMLDWAASLRQASVPSVFEDVVDAVASLVDTPVVQIRDFIDAVAEDMPRLPELAVEATTENPVVIKTTLILEVPDEATARVSAAFEKAGREIAEN